MEHSQPEADDRDDVNNEELNEDEVGSQGNRSNLVYTLCRVNPCDFQTDNIYVDTESNEVEVINPNGYRKNNRRDAWILDDTVDNIPRSLFDNIDFSGDCKASLLKFSDQEEIWNKIKNILESRLAVDGGTIGLLAVGAHGSGKSHTLFGSMDGGTNAGIVPRVIRSLFTSTAHVSYIFLQMFVVMNEEIHDLFDASHSCYKHNGEMAYSGSLGSIVMPINTLVAFSAEDCLDFVSMGHMSVAALMMNSSNFWGPANLVISMQLFSHHNNRYSRIIFVEGAPLHTPKPLHSSVDRFTAQSQTHVSARELYNSVKISPFGSSPNDNKSAKEYQSGVISYILQDCLYKVFLFVI
jgi:hypothetical protein